MNRYIYTWLIAVYSIGVTSCVTCKHSYVTEEVAGSDFKLVNTYNEPTGSYGFRYLNGAGISYRKEYREDSTLKVEFFREGNAYHGEYKEYWANGKLKTYKYYCQGREEGEVKLYHENGQLHKVITYDMGKLHGDYKIFDQNGTLRQFGVNIKGKRNGVWLYYDEDGNLEREYEH